MGLDRNFFSDGKGNHRISGIQSIPSKTGIIDSSSFVLEKRLAWADIGGEERNMGLAQHRSASFPLRVGEHRDSNFQTSDFNLEASIFNFEVSILIFSSCASWQCQTPSLGVESNGATPSK